MKQTSLPAHVQAAWDSGRKLEAIQALHAATGMDLARAKALLERRAAASAHPAMQVLQALKTAKAAKSPASAPVSPTDTQASFGPGGLAPGEVPRSQNRMQLGILVAALVFLVVWLLH